MWCFVAKPINGWGDAEEMAPWRSPERAPEYADSGSGDKPRKSEAVVRSASFAGDPTQARSTPWGEGR